MLCSNFVGLAKFGARQKPRTCSKLVYPLRGVLAVQPVAAVIVLKNDIAFVQVQVSLSCKCQEEISADTFRVQRGIFSLHVVWQYILRI